MKRSTRLFYLVTSAPIGLFLLVARLLPFRWRVGLGGVLFGLAVRFVPELRDRVLENLGLVRPEWSDAQARRFCFDMGRQFGRTTTEILFGHEHRSRHLDFHVSGPGLAAIRAARDAGKPILLVSAHFGQWDAARLYLREHEGVEVGALYRPLNNPFVERVWYRGIASAGEPLLPKGREGLRGMLAHLRDGGAMAILADQHQMNGVPLPFLGHPAMTVLAPAELAIKFDAVLVPVFSLRRDADRQIDIVFEDPLVHARPEDMMAEFNRRASARIEAHPDQWLWPHRRWKL